MRRGYFVKNSIAFVCMVVSLCCFLILFLSTLKLPEVSSSNDAVRSHRTTKDRKFSENWHLGMFGNMLVEMLPQDLAFTIFVPSEKAFWRDLRLNVNESFAAENINNTYAIVSRVLGFSAVPRALTSDAVPVGKEISYDSLSGFTLYISKAVNGKIVVNRVQSESLDRRKGEIVVHIMDGVIMDADFKQSVQPDYDEGR
ncbi:uncharacterized protein LOC115690494 [Syzygium oleosum]|uniref:uncharacterized protein LOC115690494 n=1 Tax=Syzygium oleosum TaxID=219896 RepID=UPI0024B93A44|nr:uncharacterized protein LOC115690494 [Syzygium oleosum]XP_056170483.1 uncharacterized protein LOC115690494 [Syzygium oleosum]